MTRIKRIKTNKKTVFIRAHSRNSLTLLLIFSFFFFIFSFFSCNGDPVEESLTLKDKYKSDFLMGNIISPSDLNNTVRFNYLKQHYNTLTAENHMKPDNIAPSSKPADDDWNYRWTNADTIVDAAIAEGMNVVGHTLIWHSQTPSWLTTGTRVEVLGNLEKYITDVADHFKGRLISWDVVNEAMRDGLTASNATNWRSCLRETGTDGSRWNVTIGPEYIEKAFLAARAADPDAKLYYNDYNLNNANKARAVYNMVNEINNNNRVGGRLLIEGIGMQTHHHLGTDPQTVKESIELFASLGVEIAISEMDIQAAGNLPVVGNITWGDKAKQDQAALYATLFRIFRDNAASISRVTFWGIDDGTSWRYYSHPTLLDKDYNPKPAFYAVMDPDSY
jgi:endo-1,4-beta-xylanase